MRLTLNCCSMLHDMRNCNYGACTPMCSHTHTHKVLTKCHFMIRIFAYALHCSFWSRTFYIYIYIIYIKIYIDNSIWAKCDDKRKKTVSTVIFWNRFSPFVKEKEKNSFGFGSLILPIKKGSMQIKTCWIVFELWRLGCVNCKCIQALIPHLINDYIQKVLKIKVKKKHTLNAMIISRHIAISCIYLLTIAICHLLNRRMNHAPDGEKKRCLYHIFIHYSVKWYDEKMFTFILIKVFIILRTKEEKTTPA